MDRLMRRSRAGFTLVEVLVAILIVAILMALLLPTVNAAFRRAKEAQVTAELNNLATALASFKNTYGDFPPSRIILCEAGFTAYLNSLTATQQAGIPGPAYPTGMTVNDLSIAQLVQRSRLYLRKFWPRVDFDGNTVGFDFNNNGTTNDVLYLSGSECLTFFLGGLPINNGNGTYGVSGFSKLPTNPFQGQAASANRTVPNYEFTVGRLVDEDGDHIPSYIDPIDISPSNQRAYAYFCSYGTNAYDPNDVNGYGKNYDPTNASNDFEFEEDATTFVERGFSVGFPIVGQTSSFYATSPAPNPYCSSVPQMSTGASMSWINPNSFQLLCAGQDRNWGLGGTYNQNVIGGTGKLPIGNALDTGIVNSQDTSNNIRNREADNLTNFSGGRLD